LNVSHWKFEGIELRFIRCVNRSKSFRRWIVIYKQ